MHIIVGVLAVAAAIIFFVVRAHGAYGAAKELNRDTQGLQRRAKSSFRQFFGTRLSRVNDPQLAATILMIQLVRTGSPVTAQEKTTILNCMADPLGIEKPQTMFEKGWDYTESRAFFSMVSDELTPLLRERLRESEKNDLIDMLTKVAEAYNGASDLQQSSITRFRKRLLA